MKTGLRTAAKAALIGPLAHGLPYRVLQRRALKDAPLTILCYHALGPDRGGTDAWTVLRKRDFRAQMADLASRYDIVSLDRALADPTPLAGRPRAVVTFDDGDRSLLRDLLPIMVETGLPATLYIATGQIETGQSYWFDRVMMALQAPGPFRIGPFGSGGAGFSGSTGSSGSTVWQFGKAPGPDRWPAISAVLEWLKTVPPGRRDALAEAVIAAAPRVPLPEPPLAPLTPAEIGYLAKEHGGRPLVTIGAHSHCHNLLDQLPLAEAEASIARSKMLLERWSGRPVRHFAYPNGNHTPELGRVLARLGFASATTLGQRLAPRGADPMHLPRLAISRYDRLDRFRLRLVGV